MSLETGIRDNNAYLIKKFKPEQQSNQGLKGTWEKQDKTFKPGLD
jgi:hypothetical protein